MKKVIQIPEKVKATIVAVKDGKLMEGEVDWEFHKWLLNAVDSYPCKGRKQARDLNRIAALLESVNGEKELLFEPNDFEILKEAAEQVDWLGAANRRFVPFYDAIENAKDEKTATDKKDEKPATDKKK